MDRRPYTFCDGQVPLLISIPHCGTEVPDSVAHLFQPEFRLHCPDTDWHVDLVYSLALEMDFPLIASRFSRYVVDLNRPLSTKTLYEDGRSETPLIPRRTFAGVPIYLSDDHDQVSAKENEQRIKRFYEPYHSKVTEILDRLRTSHKRILFFDAHSIKRSVPSIQESPFPDLILGSNDGMSADSDLVRCAIDALSKSRYEVALNQPFKGGQLTRAMGKPNSGINALQLEMSQDIYMNEETLLLDVAKLKALQECLRGLLTVLTKQLERGKNG
jgi:N-formylglutamate deformylase